MQTEIHYEGRYQRMIITMDRANTVTSRGFLIGPTTSWTDIWRRKQQRQLLESLQAELIVTNNDPQKEWLRHIIAELQSELNEDLLI